MTYSLEAFHFNPRKSGQIFKSICKEKGISQASLASRTGLSYDTVGNVFAGKVQEISFERVFKFCTVLGVPIEVYMMLMLKDEAIDFEDRVLLYNNRQDDVTPMADVEPSQVPSPVPDAVSAAAAAAAAVPPPDHVAMDTTQTYYSREDLYAVIERIDSRHAAQVSQLIESRQQMREQYESHLAAIRQHHQIERDTAEKHYNDAQQLIRQLIGQR